MNAIKKVLITGGTGFIGTEVTKKLVNEGIKCFIFTRQDLLDTDNIKYLKIDINQLNSENASDIKDKIGEVDSIIYMAASIPLQGEKKETYLEAKEKTLDPIIKFCDLFMPITKKFIYISSIDVNGQMDELDYDESHIPEPSTPYGLAKYCGEFYVNNISKQYNVSPIILRFSQVYGFNEPLVRVIPILLKAIREKEVFNKYTTGNEKRRFLFVEDAVSSIIQALKSNETGIFNIAGKSVDSINDLIQISQKVYNQEIKIDIKNNLVAGNNVPSINKAKEILKYEPQYTLTDGIKRIHKEEKL